MSSRPVRHTGSRQGLASSSSSCFRRSLSRSDRVQKVVRVGELVSEQIVVETTDFGTYYTPATEVGAADERRAALECCYEAVYSLKSDDPDGPCSIEF